jgi:hypothetical protein
MRLFVFSTALLLSCRVTFPEHAKYACTSDADCGGDGYKCAPVAGMAGGDCCLPTGPEICDGIDNDCDGIIDDTGKPEICNGIDDNCDGRIDEGFDLQTDPANCGACNHACAAAEICQQGSCAKPTETNCADGIDNDGNGLTDCADPSCAGLSCGTGCGCAAGRKTELACHDGLDNDGDGLVDCADPDCTGKSCGPGCACAADAGFTETICNNAIDDDHDGLVDCADPDCAGQLCGTATLTFTCTAFVCDCNGGPQITEHGALCGDGIDNDCNGKIDCADALCDGQPCSPDGGSGTCQGGACR